MDKTWEGHAREFGNIVRIHTYSCIFISKHLFHSVETEISGQVPHALPVAPFREGSVIVWVGFISDERYLVHVEGTMAGGSEIREVPQTIVRLRRGVIDDHYVVINDNASTHRTRAVCDWRVQTLFLLIISLSSDKTVGVRYSNGPLQVSLLTNF